MTTDANAPWLIVGLGNPGSEYANNRHNVGFMVADLLAERIGGKFKRAGKAQAQVLEGRIGAPGPASRRVVLVKPTSFMNLSGGPVNALRDFYKVPSRTSSPCTTSWTSTTAPSASSSAAATTATTV